jgi:MoxR-like ATPase
MNSPSRFIFTGEQPEPPAPHPESPSEPEPYIASPGLIQAVNLAIHIGRPLLLEGEAGCGKTRLARAVAYELGLPLYAWHIRSTSKAQEGLYSYDAILRLHDVQIRQLDVAGQSGALSSNAGALRNPGDPTVYRKLGPLGKAFALTDCPAVVLIDEIDKADIDFPNDLLAVLDDPWEFEIQETGEKIQASNKPIIIITSNKEKGNLPFPFLRRCIYYYVEFPGESTLRRIVEEHYKNRDDPPSADLIETAAQRFIDIRNAGKLHKIPSTSEFLDWVEALHNLEPARDNHDHLLDEQHLPYPSLLLKLHQDWRWYSPVA